MTRYLFPCKMRPMPRSGEPGEVQWEAQRVRALRRHMSRTQQQWARELGVRQQTVSEWERSVYRPRGASATLLHIVAERAEFHYSATQEEAPEGEQAP